MIASLPMYDLPELRRATDAWYAGIRDHARREGVEMPDTLSRATPDLPVHWRDPMMILSQTCGWPMARMLADAVIPIATLHYSVTGCEGPRYSSVIVVRDGDGPADLSGARGLHVVFNGHDSQSGFHGLRRLVADLADGRPFFGSARASGAHRESARLVLSREADIAAIDAVTFHLLRVHAPDEVRGLRAIGWTEKAPGLPYITSVTNGAETADRLRTALLAALEDPGLAVARAALLITGCTVLDHADYEPLGALSEAADSRTCPTLMLPAVIAPQGFSPRPTAGL